MGRRPKDESPVVVELAEWTAANLRARDAYWASEHGCCSEPGCREPRHLHWGLCHEHVKARQLANYHARKEVRRG